MRGYIIVLIILLILLAIFLLIWLAYSVTAAHQQTLSVDYNFRNTYRYVFDKMYRIDNIEITVTKRDKNSDLIILKKDLDDIIYNNVIREYRNTIFVQEDELFSMSDNKLARISTEKAPILENLTRLFFTNLSKKIGETGYHLISLKLESEGVSVTSSRYKISDYSV